MSYSKSKQLTDSEKKLRLIKSQLYGKEREEENTFKFDSSNIRATMVSKPTSTNTSYLRHDLIKTLILATLAITAQLIVYFGLQRGVFKF